MKQGKLVSLIKEVVKQEVKKQITDILINETNIPKAKPVIKKKKVNKIKGVSFFILNIFLWYKIRPSTAIKKTSKLYIFDTNI